MHDDEYCNNIEELSVIGFSSWTTNSSSVSNQYNYFSKKILNGKENDFKQTFI